MPEFAKTLIFVGVAALVAVVAWGLRPVSLKPPQVQIAGKLFGEIGEDATVADALEIVRYDQDVGEAKRLKVARGGEGWILASHNDYPADASDAQERIHNAALTLMDLTVDGLASETTTDHALLGVVSPEGPQVREANPEDIGILVALENQDGRKMAQLVIGKPVQGQSQQRFVRKEGDAKVYTAKIDVGKLSSDFGDWIEADLLDIHARDIRQVTLKDYSAEMINGILPSGQFVHATRQKPRFEMVVDWDSDSQWQLREFREFRDQRMVPARLSDDEQLSAEKLDALKQAIDDLAIVDVQSKPKELLAGVKSDEDLLADERLRAVLEARGFYPFRGELLGSNGEVRVQTDDGVEYILRFGQEAGIEGGDDVAKVNRYLLVSARVAENQFQPRPPSTLPPTGDEAASDPVSGASGDSGEQGEPADKADDAPAAEGVSDADEAAPAPQADETSEGEGADDESILGPPEGASPAAEPEEADDSANKRRAAEEKVEQLNKKFSKWFYVVSEDVYKKLRLGKFDVIQPKDEASFGLDELRGLEGPLPDLDDEP